MKVFAEFGARTQDSGNVSYGVEIDGHRYFVKTAGDPADTKPFLPHAERVALLRNAAKLARSCDHPGLPRLHDVIEAPSGPMLVYDFVAGELLGVPRAQRDDPGSSFQRFRALPVHRVLAALDSMYELHRDLAAAGWIAVDFYDGSLIYDFDTHRIWAVDLDNYHQGPFANPMGRMFGSTRFMSPEEFELGAPIDERTTVFVLGRTACVFLPEESLSDVVRTACAADRSNRFATVAEFCEAWSATRQA